MAAWSETSVDCPLCGESVSIPIMLKPQLSHVDDVAGTMTVVLQAGNVQHTCPRDVEGEK